jgi:tetratricopeptide (TPR) repeat protein
LLPIGFAILIGIFTFIVGAVTVRFLVSDYLFQKSLVAASQNDAQRTYQLQTQAINMFPQRDGYHRIFSQINLSIANNLAASIPQGTQPTQEQQQTIYQLIQQSINSGRNAATISPQTSVNWQNLSSIYRALIGFGQNADQFALLSNQQAILLDPNNPQEYISYGGIFYQLGQWDNAIRQFQIAASLKPNFANAYYNLGHALESKGDLQAALQQYQTVRSLVANDKASRDVIDAEIKALQEKIGQAGSGDQSNAQPAGNQPPLGVDQPAAQLPEQDPEVEIPGLSPTPSPRPGQATPSRAPSPTRAR